ncbi:MAG: TraV family lipoprotein [Nitrospiraceae bacterium]|nr:TraV family lipoprotein [Nitrospiraceae bacterium]
MRTTILAAFFIMIFSMATGTAFAEDGRWESGAGVKPIPDTGVAQQATQHEMPLVEAERQQRMISVLKKPPIPMKMPDKILRVLFLPYVDQHNVLNNYKYSFMKVEEGKWVIGDYLMEPARVDRVIINPIENTQKPAAANSAGNKGQKKPDQKTREIQ